MDTRSDEGPVSNRDKKVAGRAKRRRHVQGTRAYTHAMTNSVAKRAAAGAERTRRPDANPEEST